MSKAFAVIAVTILLLTGALSIAYAGGEAGHQYDVDNESWTADPGNTTNLSDSRVPNAVYDANVTVRDENHTRMQAGEDYEWNTENGTVTALENGSLSDGEQAYIWYSYGVPNTQQLELMTMFWRLYELGGPFIYLLMVGVILGSILKFVE